MTDVVASMWRTAAFRELATPLAAVLGDKTAKAFAALRLVTVGDLLRHLPRRYLSGTELTDLATLEEGDFVAVMARVAFVEVKHSRGAPSKTRVDTRLEAILTDGQGKLRVTFFGREHMVSWWERELGKGVRGIFVGKVGSFNGALQMTHPKFVMLDAAGAVVGRSEEKERIAELSQSGLVGFYPASAKLPTWTIAACAQFVLNALDGSSDPWPAWVREQAAVCELATAFRHIHRPSTLADTEMGRGRLLFDEAFTTQLTMAYRRADNARQSAGPRVRRPGGLLDAFESLQPFALTEGQRHVEREILADMERQVPMQRLLQGEVGSGKTVVALRAMLAVVDTGGQAVLLAPTEVLAMQHARTIRAMLGELAGGRLLGSHDQATDVALLTGSMSAIAKKNTLLKIASGEAGIVIGTHALLAERVQYADLGLVVVDEQHRFGVEQRSLLNSKTTARPHVLVLTATPIPRSVAMTVFGDLEVSTLAEIPAGRQPVQTTVVNAVEQASWVDRAWQRVREEVNQGRQVFVVASRIGGTKREAGQPEGVVALYERLSSGPLEGLRLGMLHGQLASDQKDRVMDAFTRGEVDVLVATTVIEVGVDVPNASMMVIWDADRFGIAQLHQLRGRIGRGSHPGVCLLVSSADAESTSWDRLRAVAATRDGFELAELDLQHRREGDVLGADQSGGRSSLRLLRVLDHAEVISRAREIAEEAVARDPDCEEPGFADAITYTEQLSAGDFIESS